MANLNNRNMTEWQSFLFNWYSFFIINICVTYVNLFRTCNYFQK